MPRQAGQPGHQAGSHEPRQSFSTIGQSHQPDFCPRGEAGSDLPGAHPKTFSGPGSAQGWAGHDHCLASSSSTSCSSHACQDDRGRDKKVSLVLESCYFTCLTYIYRFTIAFGSALKHPAFNKVVRRLVQRDNMDSLAAACPGLSTDLVAQVISLSLAWSSYYTAPGISHSP